MSVSVFLFALCLSLCVCVSVCLCVCVSAYESEEDIVCLAVCLSVCLSVRRIELLPMSKRTVCLVYRYYQGWNCWSPILNCVTGACAEQPACTSQ